MNNRLRVALLVAMVAASSCCLRDSSRWVDTFESRVEILALIQTLNADILASRSATATLERWCADHRMADAPKVVAQRIKDVEKRPTAEQLQRLGVTGEAEVRYRHVRLRCGAHVLSEADNWYVPARLTPEMNRLLETTDVSFGTAVRDLHPYRQTLSATMLWSPLSAGWELRMRPKGLHHPKALSIPQQLFEHRAILLTADNIPFSEVDEVYQAELLEFTRRPND